MKVTQSGGVNPADFQRPSAPKELGQNSDTKVSKSDAARRPKADFEQMLDQAAASIRPAADPTVEMDPFKGREEDEEEVEVRVPDPGAPTPVVGYETAPTPPTPDVPALIGRPTDRCKHGIDTSLECKECDDEHRPTKRDRRRR